MTLGWAMSETGTSLALSPPLHGIILLSFYLNQLQAPALTCKLVSMLLYLPLSIFRGMGQAGELTESVS